VDRSEKPILSLFLETTLLNSSYIIQPLIGSISAIISGVLADFMGRKRVVIYGFVLLGLSFAPLGIAPTIEASKYFYIIVDAIGGGILWTLFILTIWGDLASYGNSEVYYLVGTAPFFVTNIIRWAIPLLLTAEQLLSLAYATFSIASVFLFLAVVPLMYAPETLPERKLRERELKQYIEKAKKVKEKFT
jgi:MFS family permease